MKKIFYILAIIAVASVFHSCGTEYFECNVMSPESDEILPQEGCALKVPFQHYPVTRFQPGEAKQDFRFQAKVNGEVYSYALTPESFDEGMDSQHFTVIVPWNDSYEERAVSIEISYDSDYSGKHWTEWEEIYSCNQLGLSNGQTPVLEDLENRTVALKSNGKTFKIDVADNASGEALKVLLLEGDLSFEMYVADNCMSSMSGDATRLLGERIPLNHKEYRVISVGELHMSDSGFFTIENENRKRGISGRDTILGQIVKEDRDSFHNFCMDESDGLIVTLTLLP
jgi:hypothetical protein